MKKVLEREDLERMVVERRREIARGDCTMARATMLRGQVQMLKGWIRELEEEAAAARRRRQQTRRTTREDAMRLARLDRPLPYLRGSDTSRLAAEDAAPEAPNHRTRILALLLMREGGMTWDRISRTLEIRPSTCRARIADLQDLGLVEDSGRRAATDSGSEAAVWVAWKHAGEREAAG